MSNYTSTLSSSSWTESSGTYTQTVSIPGILSTDTPIIDVSNPTQAMLDSWAYVSKMKLQMILLLQLAFLINLQKTLILN